MNTSNISSIVSNINEMIVSRGKEENDPRRLEQDIEIQRKLDKIQKIIQQGHTVDGQYGNICENILNTGVRKDDRTGTGTLSVFGGEMTFDISCGKIPLLTTKKVYLRAVIHELLWFLSGDTDVRYLKENNVNIWDSWVDGETATYRDYSEEEIIGIIKKHFGVDTIHLDHNLSTNHRYTRNEDHSVTIKVGENETWKEVYRVLFTKEPRDLVSGDLPNVYGKQWRRWEHTTQILEKDLPKYEALGYEVVGKGGKVDGVYSDDVLFVHREIDQIQRMVEQLKKDPDSRRIILSPWNVGELEMMALPPCFTENALVEVSTGGYKKIADVDVGERVLTDKNRHRSVLEKWKTPYQGKMVSITPAKSNIPIEATPNHPFLVKGKGWVNAADLEENDFLAITQTNYEYNHSFFYDRPHYTQGHNVVIERHIKCEIEDYYTFGYFLGNGWMVDENRIHFSIPVTKVEKILPKIRRTIKVAEKKMHSETVKTFETRSLKWSGPFSDFGKHAHNKKIPDWVMRSSKEAKIAFLEGFMDADGHVPKDGFFSVCTTSPHIAYGLQRLYSEFGFFGRIAHQKRNPTTIIEGRTVNQRDTYTFEVNTKPINNMTNHSFDDEVLWVAIKNIETFDYDGYVYNLHVEEDNTYTVNNIITHNCHCFFQLWTRKLSIEERIEVAKAKGRNIDFMGYLEGGDPSGENALNGVLTAWEIPERELSSHLHLRSNDMPLGNPFNIAQYAILTHMFAHVTNMTTGTFKWTGGDTHVYLDQVEALEGQLKRQPYPDSAWVMLNPEKKNVDDFVFEDFKVFDYKSHGPVKFPTAAV